MLKAPLKEARAEVTIRNMRGLHARASRKFAEMAQSFDAKIWVKRADKDDAQAVNGASIMDLMMLAAQPGVKLHITARGDECEQALEALIALANDYFDETD